MPAAYVGGRKGVGVENLRQYLELGGRLIFLNQSSDFAIDQFNLPVFNVVRGLSRRDFFVSGSILRIQFDDFHPIGTLNSKFAYFENGPAFEILRQKTEDKRPETDPSDAASPVSPLPSPVSAVRIIARYPSDPKQILLSGWALGPEKIAGKAALVEFNIGKGKIILFGFRPQYRGQSLATFPLLFNAISQ